MLPTPSWLRLRKSRSQQQQQQQRHQQQQLDPQQQQQQQQQPQLQRAKSVEQEPELNRLQGAEPEANKGTRKKCSGTQNDRKQKVNAQSASAAAASAASTTTTAPVEAQFKSSSRSTPPSSASGQLSGLLPRALAGLLQRAFTSTADRPPTSRNPQSRATAQANRPKSPLRKITLRALGGGVSRQNKHNNNNSTTTTTTNTNNNNKNIIHHRHPSTDEISKLKNKQNEQLETEERQSTGHGRTPEDKVGQFAAGTSQAEPEASRGHTERNGLTSGHAVSCGTSSELVVQVDKTSTSSANANDVCHLTARTRNNQCALHGHDTSAKIEQLGASVGASGASGPIRISANKNNSSSRSKSNSNNETKTATTNGSPNKQTLSLSSSSTATATATTTTTTATATRRQKRKSKARSGVAIWPLAKQTLADNSSFGDCEDIQSAHLTGRVLRLPLQVGGKHTTSGLGASGPQMNEVNALLEALDSALEAAKRTNYNHKRPFAQPFERPTAVWILNATKPDYRRQINLGGGNCAGRILAGREVNVAGQWDDVEGEREREKEGQVKGK